MPSLRIELRTYCFLGRSCELTKQVLYHWAKKAKCVKRESNPRQRFGKPLFYHWTINASDFWPRTFTEVVFPGTPRGGKSFVPWEEWGLNPRAFASDLKADSLTTRTSSRFGLSWFWIFVNCFLGRLPTHHSLQGFRPSLFFRFFVVIKKRERFFVVTTENDFLW